MRMNPSSPAIDIEGYVFRFELINGNQTWTRKWAILCDYCLYLYDNHGDKECKFAVVLPGARLSNGLMSDGDGFQKKAMLIEERNGMYVQLAAENESEFQRWWEHLSAAVVLQKVETHIDPSFTMTLPEGFQIQDPPPGRANFDYSAQPLQAPMTFTDVEPQEAPMTFTNSEPLQAPMTFTDGEPLQVPMTFTDGERPQAELEVPTNQADVMRQSTHESEQTDGPPYMFSVPERRFDTNGSARLEFVAPKRAVAMETLPTVGLESNGHLDQYGRGFGSDIRFQSFPELSTLERQRLATGDPNRPSSPVAALLDRQDSRPETQQRFQSIPDLRTMDRQRHFNDLRRPSAPVPARGSSLTQLAMETVKEDPGMPEADILATLPLSEIRKRYPVSGLAKRMSIAASDLLGKSHDELVLSLIQLYREKANLETIRDYCLQVLDNIDKGMDDGQDGIFPENLEEKKVCLQSEIDDANHQIEISMPLITFIDNIVKMGSLFGGNDVMFATEYRKHLLSPDQYWQPTSSISFVRGVQERKVADTLSRRSRGSTGAAEADGDGDESSTYAHLQESGSGVEPVPESSAFVKSRAQLETELAELENIVVHYHLRKSQMVEFMGRMDAEPHGLGVITEEGDTNEFKEITLRRSLRRGVSSSSDEPADTPEKAHHPRRSSSRLLRSDMLTTLRTRAAEQANQTRTLPPNLMARLQRGNSSTLGSRSRTLPANFPLQTRPVNGSQGVYDRASPAPVYNSQNRSRYASLPARYILDEAELVDGMRRVGRVPAASDSRLNRVGPAPITVKCTSATGLDMETTDGNRHELAAEHIYQNEPLGAAQSTPSLFRASLTEMAGAGSLQEPNWTTVYEQGRRPLHSNTLDPLSQSSGMVSSKPPPAPAEWPAAPQFETRRDGQMGRTHMIMS